MRGYLTVTESAKWLGISVDVFRRLLHKGKMRATRFGPVLAIKAEDLEPMLWRRVGRPLGSRMADQSGKALIPGLRIVPRHLMGVDALRTKISAEGSD